MKFFRYALAPFMTIWFMLAMTAPAAEAPAPEPSPSAPQQISSGGELTIKRFPAVLGHNLTSHLFTRGNFTPFLVGAAGALAIAREDQEISKSMKNHAREFGDAGEILGAAVPLSITGGAFLTSRFSKSDHFRSFGYTIAQAYATNFVLLQGIKLATNRMRPDGSASNSFPSGHGSGAFSVATVVANYYGKKWGIPLYAFAGLVGISRIEHGSHWPSDVVAGAALGYISGRTAILGTKQELSGKKTTRLMIMPVYGRDTRSFSVCFVY